VQIGWVIDGYLISQLIDRGGRIFQQAQHTHTQTHTYTHTHTHTHKHTNTHIRTTLRSVFLSVLSNTPWHHSFSHTHTHTHTHTHRYNTHTRLRTPTLSSFFLHTHTLPSSFTHTQEQVNIREMTNRTPLFAKEWLPKWQRRSSRGCDSYRGSSL
jgi:hypothetical protein